MNILCTFPGRYGDILWALPALRALCLHLHRPVDLQICGEFKWLVPLISAQPYIGEVFADLRWALTPPEEWHAPMIPGYHHVFHLGYRGWPQRPLPFETLDNLNNYLNDEGQGWIDHALIDTDLHLETPWITAPPKADVEVAWLCAFTEAHFELKYGLWELLTHRPTLHAPRYSWQQRPLGTGPLSICTGARWQKEAGHGGMLWAEMAEWLKISPLLLTDCSAPHVLAVAMGIPAVLCEPMEARWNPIFYPLGMDGPQVTVVKGTDGKPTFDARHVGDAIEAALARLKERRS